MLGYLLEGRRSYFEETERRARPPEKNLVATYERQEEDSVLAKRSQT